MMRLLATATAAHALLFSPTPGVLVLSPALTGPRTTFSVGPHAGESYERVWREDPQFCVWALEQPAPRAELEDFQAWLRSKSKARRAPVKLTMRRPKPIVPTPVAYPDTLEPDVVLQHQEDPEVDRQSRGPAPHAGACRDLRARRPRCARRGRPRVMLIPLAGQEGPRSPPS